MNQLVPDRVMGRDDFHFGRSQLNNLVHRVLKCSIVRDRDGRLDHFPHQGSTLGLGQKYVKRLGTSVLIVVLEEGDVEQLGFLHPQKINK